jgi:hypothetical protein
VPTRRLVVALSVLLFGVLAIGIGTALNRAGDDGKSPSATPTTQAPFVSETPSETPTPEPTVEETPTPTPTTPSPAPSVSGNGSGSGGNGSGSGSGGNGGGPKMPNTGLPAAVAPLALVTLGAAAALQQRRRHLHDSRA